MKLKNFIHLFSILFISFISIQCAISQSEYSDRIRLNQLGFYPNGPKMAIVVDDTIATEFTLVSADTKETVFTGQLKQVGKWQYSEELVSQADFSKFSKEGRYYIYVKGVGNSLVFKIDSRVHFDAGKAALRFFYYQRASTALPEKYAGKWHRASGHPDNEVYVHASAASETRAEGSTFSSPYGWYDAGDYNKYIVNSGISTYTLMALYEHYPKFFDTLKLNIPESNNNIPDILDEVYWNLRWMITMQDADGGVYHKLTNTNFDGSVMPEKATAKRYVVMKSTAATLDFAATLAHAARVYKRHNKKFADSCLKAAVNAWMWAKKNKNVLYNQSVMNSKFNPDVVTGAYDDSKLNDEFQWAAMELYVSTGKLVYFEEANLEYTLRADFGLPGWQTVNTLGLYTLAHERNNLPEDMKENIQKVKDKVLAMADEYKKHALKKSEYGVPMGTYKSDFGWGSNSFCANEGVMLMQAYDLTGDASYLEAAIAALDYLLGRNATTYSFVSGYGVKPIMNPHHRPSEGDGIVEPVPGMLSGGPNPGQEDMSNCGGKYTSKLPAKSFIDEQCSYASNEVAINWNAPLAYLLMAIEATKGTSKK